MQRLVIPGGWYGEALPSGAWAALVPHQGLQSHLGPIPLPPGETFGPGFVRITEVGGFRLAGQAHDTLDPACWEWVAAGAGGTWTSYPPPCVGVSPVIYDRGGRLLRSDGAVGSQGYRYVTPANQVISGDATYGPFHGLFEYTALDTPGLWVGQGATDGSGCQLWDATDPAAPVLRQVELGDCRFLRARQAGDQVALAFMAADGVVLLWTTVAELRALPPVVAPPAPVTFQFTHPVSVYPFKAEGSGLPDLFTLGTYSEAPAPPDPLPADQRLLLAHDGQADWVVPSGHLRAWDLCLIECYLVKGETLDQSVVRWDRQARSLLQQWPGDCGLIPMFYCQGGAPPDELWPVSAVCDGLRRLSPIVNLSLRIKILAPFAYHRANGVVAHPELQQALDALAAEAARVGPAALTPVPGPPQPQPPQPPEGASMLIATLDNAKVYPYKALKPSSQPGCVNVILLDDRVLSAHGDDRDPGTDGPWEQAQVTGAAAAFAAGGEVFVHLVVPADKLPR